MPLPLQRTVGGPAKKFHAPRFTFSSTNFPFPVHNRLHWRGNLLRGGTTRMEQELRRLPDGTYAGAMTDEHICGIFRLLR